MTGVVTPTYQSGFASPQRGRILHPKLWKQCRGAWAALLGPTGTRLRDQSCSLANGTMAAAMSPNTGWATSQGQWANKYDGTDDYQDFGNALNSVFVGSGKQFWFSFWMQPQATMTNNMIIAKLATATPQRQWFLRLFTDSKIEFLWYGDLNASSFRGTIGSTICTDTTRRYHCIVAYDGANATINDRVSMWVDGVPETVSIVNTTGTPSEIQSGTGSLTIGAFNPPTPSNFFNGYIFEIELFDGRPTQGQIDTLKLRPGIMYEPGQRRQYKAAAAASRNNLMLLGVS